MDSVNQWTSEIWSAWPSMLAFSATDYVTNELLSRPVSRSVGMVGLYLLGGAAMATKMLIWGKR